VRFPRKLHPQFLDQRSHVWQLTQCEEQSTLALVCLVWSGRDIQLERDALESVNHIASFKELSLGGTRLTRRPASADRTARRLFQAVFPVITGSFPTLTIARLCIMKLYSRLLSFTIDRFGY